MFRSHEMRNGGKRGGESRQAAQSEAFPFRSSTGGPFYIFDVAHVSVFPPGGGENVSGSTVCTGGTKKRSFEGFLIPTLL